MPTEGVLHLGRKSFNSQAWEAAYDQLSAADREAPLCLDDLERLAIAAHMSGRDEESAAAWERAHHESLRQNDMPRAARCAFWIAFPMAHSGEVARASGWVNRARRLLDERGLDCVERGYLQLPAAVHLTQQAQYATASAVFKEVGDVARRFKDEPLRIMADVGVAYILVMVSKAAEGLAMFDELMVSAGACDLSPIARGLVYCAAIECCQAAFDLRRAQEWTATLERWCVAQEGLVPYQRECFVHRSEVLQLQGAWPEALQEARRVSELSPQAEASGAALYQQAEIYRLQGEFAKAEETYRLCSRAGHSAQPGLALLRLAQGQVEAAAAAIRVVLDAARNAAERARVLPTFVEIMLAADDVEAARRAADDLSALASALQAPLLTAAARHANGAVLLREGDARSALMELRRAFAGWQAIETPYEAARTRVLMGIACRQLGDRDTAEIELDAARWLFQKLGAAPDLARVESLAPQAASRKPGGLTERELEVLRLVVADKTNRAIAAELFISEHTVRRHLQNIFAKLGVSSRSGATAFAFQHGLA